MAFYMDLDRPSGYETLLFLICFRLVVLTLYTSTKIHELGQPAAQH